MNSPSRTRGKTRLASALAASAIGIGLLAVPGTAHATPRHPQNALKCKSFALSNSGIAFSLRQDNGVEVLIPVSDFRSVAVGKPEASYDESRGQTASRRTYGTASGGLSGRTINIKVNWTKGPGAGFSNTYTGQVDDQGVSTGTTTNNRGTTNKWRGSRARLPGCASSSAAGPQAAEADRPQGEDRDGGPGYGSI